MLKQGMTILYVSDQEASKAFYKEVFGFSPSMDVPGMTEFQLVEGLTLGLMPRAGIQALIGKSCLESEDLTSAKAELYITVDDAETYLSRAIKAGAKPVLGVEARDWGDRVGYCQDLDGYIIALAETQ